MLTLNKKTLFGIVLTVTVITAFCVLYFQKNSNFIYKRGSFPEYDKAASAALDIYKREAKGMDLSTGPCLTNDLIPGWVADIVHNPRQALDDLPQNECQAYLEGRAKHFVELDLSGNVIRVN